MFAGITIAQLIKLAAGSEPVVSAILAMIRSRHPQTPPVVNEDGSPIGTWDEVHTKIAGILADLDTIEASADRELGGSV